MCHARVVNRQQSAGIRFGHATEFACEPGPSSDLLAGSVRQTHAVRAAAPDARRRCNATISCRNASFSEESCWRLRATAPTCSRAALTWERNFANEGSAPSPENSFLSAASCAASHSSNCACSASENDSPRVARSCNRRPDSSEIMAKVYSGRGRQATDFLQLFQMAPGRHSCRRMTFVRR